MLGAGLAVGVELDRERARRVRRELRRHEASAMAARAIGRRDLSEQELTERLDRAHVPPAARDVAVDRLLRAGAVDDRRLAFRRAGLLAERGSGDALIRQDLARRGIAEELVTAAIEELEPEPIRAAQVVAHRGRTPATARYLARKGFSEDSVEASCEIPVAEHGRPAVR